jgi:tRNA 2-thiouridine synthesizing protein E
MAIKEEGMTPQARYRNPERGRKNKPLLFDEDGFLINTDAWSFETARLMAEIDGIGSLGPDHLAVIAYLREMYMQSGGLPVMSRICRSLNLAKHGVHTLFGSCRIAWRIAGLPHPGEEAKTYMT